MTQEEMAAVFTEWDRQYREKPEEFMSSVEHLLRNTPQTYGDRAAVFFLEIARQLKEKS